MTPNWTLAQAVAPAISGGVNLVIYRETDLPAGPRATVGRFLQDGIRGRAPLLVVDAGAAMDIVADGVFLENSDRAAAAREAIGEMGILGVLASSPDSIGPAVDANADFVMLNVGWSDPTSALESVKQYRKLTALSLLIGLDMSPEQAVECMALGADGIVIQWAAMAAYNRTEEVRKYARAAAAGSQNR